MQVTGVGTTRESITTNELVLAPTLKHLGVRPGVQTCMLHIKALYDLMEIPIPGFWPTLELSVWCWQYS